MHSPKRYLSLALVPLAFTLAAAAAQAQETPAATPAPSAPPVTRNATPMDRAYDGNWHVTLAPYLWLPTVRTNVKYTIPQLPLGGGGGSLATNVQVGPSDYLSSLNSAGQMAFNVRKGDAEFFGDYIFMNLSSTANFNSLVSGPLGKVKIPVSLVTNSRLAASIWELGAGFSLAHGHNGDANLFVGWRQFPLTTNLAWTGTIGGSKLAITRAGTVRISPLANDVVFGLNGKIFSGDNHWFAPYYIDYGAGATQQTWEGYGGAGYMFDHGQSMVVAFRTLNYNAFPPDSPVQKLSMWGPLLGYSFGL